MSTQMGRAGDCGPEQADLMFGFTKGKWLAIAAFLVVVVVVVVVAGIALIGAFKAVVFCNPRDPLCREGGLRSEQQLKN